MLLHFTRFADVALLGIFDVLLDMRVLFENLLDKLLVERGADLATLSSSSSASQIRLPFM